MKLICFDSPNGANGYLSNRYPSSFAIGEDEFFCVEQFMMYTKALTFNDDDIAEQILDSEDPDEINELGRQVSGYDDVIWNGLRQAVVYEGLKAKFEQDDELCARLLATDEALLAECTVKEYILGIGLSILDANRKDIDCWKGQNLLGFSLMRVR